MSSYHRMTLDNAIEQLQQLRNNPPSYLTPEEWGGTQLFFKDNNDNILEIAKAVRDADNTVLLIEVF